jgi:hypothetical protein
MNAARSTRKAEETCIRDIGWKVTTKRDKSSEDKSVIGRII